MQEQLLTDTLLENNKDFDIFFIQELPWCIIHNILSSLSKERDEIISAPNYSLWTLFARIPNTVNEHLKVLTYINSKLIKLCFLLRRDIINYKDINLLFFFNHSIMYFLINIHLDEYQSTLKYFKNTEVNLNNILIMTGDLNIRDNDWDPSFSYHSIHVDTLRKIANSFDLELSILVHQVPM